MQYVAKIIGGTCIREKWTILGAMPYYVENRNGYEIITKAHHSQNNGILISYLPNMKYVAMLDRQEEVINEMCDYIEKLNVDKYEQQYHYSFTNCLPLNGVDMKLWFVIHT